MGHNCVRRFTGPEHIYDIPVRKKVSKKEVMSRGSYDYTIPAGSAGDAFAYFIKLSERHRQVL